MVVFNIDDFIARIETILSTQKGTVLDSPDFGFDWESFSRSMLTDETLIDFTQELKRCLNYFIENGLSEEISVDVEKTGYDSITGTAEFTINEENYLIEISEIKLNAGEYNNVQLKV